MNKALTRNDGQLLKLLEGNIREHMQQVIVERGWEYFRKGYVRKVEVHDQHLLTGVVAGSELYAVSIDVMDFAYSRCTCPYGGFCKHMAAVFFAFCDHNQALHGTPESAYRRLTGLQPEPAQRAAVVVEQRGKTASTPGMDASPADWQAWMEQEYGESWRVCRHSLHSLQPVLSALKGTSKDWDKKKQRLHWMNVILFVLDQAEQAIKAVDSFSRYYHEMSFVRMAEPWLEHYYTLVLELEPAEMLEDERDWADAVVGYAYNRALRKEQQLFDWPYIYLALCGKMSENRDWQQRELASMLASAGEQTEAADEQINDTFIHTAIAMMYFFDGQDEEALAHFGKTDFRGSQKMVYTCAAQRLEEGEWEPFEAWMTYLYKHIYAIRSGRTVGPFLTLCRRADTDQPDNIKWTSYMTSLLPHSYSELTDHWFAQKKYEEWAELQMLIGALPDDLPIQDVREVSKVNPRVMMPLYHQAIESWISSRNRQGYRMAVKQLKKLERIYKAEKEMDRWQVYITGIGRKYQRLRAFQEELWKGKIVT
ncbi:SWIM zinc finger family protein [Paenibacillus sp. KS-LC4]|uniref:SWIM zinc finger family protein n=1 Tax=Paenibacillus sp. KS-LC4 TaxID=2979727 RepID=UPI0030D06D06